MRNKRYRTYITLDREEKIRKIILLRSISDHDESQRLLLKKELKDSNKPKKLLKVPKKSVEGLERNKYIRLYYKSYVGDKCNYTTYVRRVKSKYMLMEEAIKPCVYSTKKIQEYGYHGSLTIERVQKRLYNGWTLEDACSIPMGTHGGSRKK